MEQSRTFPWILCAATFTFNILNCGMTSSAGLLYIMFKENVEGGDSAIALVNSLNLAMYSLSCKYSER